MNKLFYCHRQSFPVMKAIIVCFFVIVFSVNLGYSQCPNVISVSTQAEIDNFPINYPNCTEIEGFVDIRDGSDITNLDGFSNIVSIGGFLAIEWCPLLENVDGLSNLTYIGQLISISNCGNLNDVSGFGNVTHYGSLWIDDCDSLVSLQGLENIAPIATEFSVLICPSLAELTTFPNLESVEGDVTLNTLPALINVNGFENLTSVHGNMSISANLLSSVSGLSSLHAVGGNFGIGGSDSLQNLNGLENLDSIGGTLSLYNNNRLENLHALVGLKSTGSDLRIHNNTILGSLSGLDSLNTIGGNLWIYENNSLETLSGIDNIQAESIQNLNITYNPQLSTCEVQSVCDYLANPNGDIQIYVNATGCNNSVEIEEACTVGIPEQTSGTPLSVYPNPFTTSTTIEYELTEPSRVQLTIYNTIGEVVYVAEDRMMPQGKHTFTWSPDRLPEGMYYGVLRSEEGVSVVKMVKQ